MSIHLLEEISTPALDALDRVYPDARFIMTHRDPAKVVPSYASLVSVIFPRARGERDMRRLGREVSEHLRILKAAGIITGEIERPRVCYFLNPKALQPLREFLATAERLDRSRSSGKV